MKRYFKCNEIPVQFKTRVHYTKKSRFALHRYNSCLLIIFALISLSSCKPKSTKNDINEETRETDTRLVMGTVSTIKLYEKGTQELYDKLFVRLSEIEKRMSVTIPTSDIARVNLAAGLGPVAISEDTFIVLQTALEYAQLSNGAFNPAIGPLVNLWAIGSDAPYLPTQTEIDKTIKLCDWRDVYIEQNTKEKNFFATAFLAKKGMSLDLGGIAKGYAADELAKILRENNIEGAIIDIGGNIYAVGKKEAGAPWRVGIKNPFYSMGAPILRVDITNTSVVTSGVYERFFEQDDRRYHHLLDTSIGYPADNGLMSVTIVAESSMIADVLATAVFVMGKEAGMDFLQESGRNGFYIDTKKNIQATAELKNTLTVLNSEFSLHYKNTE